MSTRSSNHVNVTVHYHELKFGPTRIKASKLTAPDKLETAVREIAGLALDATRGQLLVYRFSKSSEKFQPMLAPEDYAAISRSLRVKNRFTFSLFDASASPAEVAQTNKRLVAERTDKSDDKSDKSDVKSVKSDKSDVKSDVKSDKSDDKSDDKFDAKSDKAEETSGPPRLDRMAKNLLGSTQFQILLEQLIAERVALERDSFNARIDELKAEVKANVEAHKSETKFETKTEAKSESKTEPKTEFKAEFKALLEAKFFNAICDRCDKYIVDARFKCVTCPDYDLCEQCVRFRASVHGGHDFVQLNAPVPVHVQKAQPIFAKPQPVPATKSFGAICDHCNKQIVDARFKCLRCPDYDLCQQCVGHRASAHGGHSFVQVHSDADILRAVGSAPVVAPQSPTASAAPALTTCICNRCHARITGHRYKCASCPDFDFCAACFALKDQLHPAHAFVRLGSDQDFIAPATPANKATHSGILCDSPTCARKGMYIRGVRYHCAYCGDTDFCDSCVSDSAFNHHSGHFLLRITEPLSREANRQLHKTVTVSKEPEPKAVNVSRESEPKTVTVSKESEPKTVTVSKESEPKTVNVSKESEPKTVNVSKEPKAVSKPMKVVESENPHASEPVSKPLKSHVREPSNKPLRSHVNKPASMPAPVKSVKPAPVNLAKPIEPAGPDFNATVDKIEDFGSYMQWTVRNTGTKTWPPYVKLRSGAIRGAPLSRSVRVNDQVVMVMRSTERPENWTLLTPGGVEFGAHRLSECAYFKAGADTVVVPQAVSVPEAASVPEAVSVPQAKTDLPCQADILSISVSKSLVVWKVRNAGPRDWPPGVTLVLSDPSGHRSSRASYRVAAGECTMFSCFQVPGRTSYHDAQLYLPDGDAIAVSPVDKESGYQSVTESVESAESAESATESVTESGDSADDSEYVDASSTSSSMVVPKLAKEYPVYASDTDIANLTDLVGDGGEFSDTDSVDTYEFVEAEFSDAD